MVHPQLNDDVLLEIFLSLLDDDNLRNFVAFRLVCKRLYHLSKLRRIWEALFKRNYLDRCHGPSHWHTNDQLEQLVLKSRKMRQNLDSDEPSVTGYKFVPLPWEESDERDPQVLIKERFLFMISQTCQLFCADLLHSLKVLWRYQLESSDRYGVDSAWTRFHDEVGLGSLMVVVCDDRHREIMVFTLQTKTGPDGCVQLTQKSVQVVSRDGLAVKHECQENWLFHPRVQKMELVDLTSLRVYNLKGLPDDYPHVALPQRTNFAGPNHIAVLLKPTNGTRHSSLVLYALPKVGSSACEGEGEGKDDISWICGVFIAEPLIHVQYVGQSQSSEKLPRPIFHFIAVVSANMVQDSFALLDLTLPSSTAAAAADDDDDDDEGCGTQTPLTTSLSFRRINDPLFSHSVIFAAMGEYHLRMLGIVSGLSDRVSLFQVMVHPQVGEQRRRQQQREEHWEQQEKKKDKDKDDEDEEEGENGPGCRFGKASIIKLPSPLSYYRSPYRLAIDDLRGRVYVVTHYDKWGVHMIDYQ